MKGRTSFLRQLKWRIVGAQMIVVIVGVTVVLFMAWLLTQYVVPSDMQARLAEMAAAQDASAIARSTEALLDAFRSSILTAVSVAAAGAVVAGLVTGILLAREILRPLREIEYSSQRIADGRYSERVAVPRSGELATVATHFNQMAEALEQVEQQRVTLIGNVAHELRTPLAALAGYLEGLMDGLFPNDTQTFGDMYHEVRRLNRLVDDLQALSRVESGQINLQIGPLALGPLVERVVGQLQPQAELKGLSLGVRNPEGRWDVCADPDRVAQVLVNLIGNAIRYTPEGGEIDVFFEEDRQAIHTLIRDTGVGIPHDALPYIFERFFRVDRSRSRRSGGSGIGLTIARYLAWAMGGELTASSPGTGAGSTFKFSLPRAKKAPANSPK